MDHIAQLRNSSNQWAKQSFVLILVEISPASGSEEHFLNFVKVFTLFSYYLPLEKDRGPSFEQTWIPFTKDCFVPSLLEIGPEVLLMNIFSY